MQKLLLEFNNTLATITLNRPDVHNAFDDALIQEFINALEKAKNSNARLLIIQANGKSFSAGADLNWMKKIANYTKIDNKKDSLQLAKLMQALYLFPKPTLAIVQGSAFGGGLGLIACCDIAIAIDTATFSLTEVKIGLVPAVIAPYIISAIGAKQMLRYALTAEKFTAATAKELGLINEVVSAELLTEKSQELISALLNNSPQAMQATKRLIHFATSKIIDANLIEHTAEIIAAARVSDEGQEGLTAFLEKRHPSWKIKI